MKIMQDGRNNQIVLNEIALKAREHVESIFTEYFSGSDFQLKSLEGMQELASWYKKTRKEDKILEKILEDIINETMKYLPQQYASLCVENIKINSKGKKQNVKFDINFQFKPIKSYVEFAVNVNKIRKKTGRIVFETNSNGTIKPVNILSNKEKKVKVSLGILSGVIQISIIELPFMEINEPIEIGSKEIEVNLSQHHVDVIDI